jgi:uncharacterized protein YdhG (YjbR/CyaY superfamily)
MKNSVDKYLEAFSGQARESLNEMRRILRDALPNAEECISYGMPAYRMTTVLVYFAGNKHHVGFYPTSSGIKKFEHELGRWKHSKGAIQFPYDQKLPKVLITNIAHMRRDETEKGAKQQCELLHDRQKATSYEQAIAKMESALRNAGLAKPALRALIDLDVKTIKALKKADIQTLAGKHGIGPHALSIIKKLIGKLD